MLREEGDAEVDSDDENGTGSDSDYQEKVLKKQMNPEDWVAGGVVLEKMFWGGSGCRRVWRRQAQVLMKNRYEAIILLCLWRFCVILFKVMSCNPKSCEIV